MTSPAPVVVHTGKDGELLEPTRAQMDALFDELKTNERVVLHFHGGLVDYPGGVAVARHLNPVYRSAGAYPVFFVWEAGLLDVLRHNIGEIAGEDFFKIVLKYVTRFAVGKVREAAGFGGKGLGLSLPNDTEIYTELAQRDTGAEPYAALAVPTTVQELSQEEEGEFALALEEDNDFQETVTAIAQSALPAPQVTGSKGVETRVRAAGRTLMSPELLDELRADAEAAKVGGQKGLFSTALLIKHAVGVLLRVVKRFRARRDHGLYPTIVEEILREFYLANVGVRVWEAMKGETSDTFMSADPVRGGWLFAEKLNELVSAGVRPMVTLVGHSTGAVFIIHLLNHFAELRKRADKPLARDYAIENIAFLAPACTFRDFAACVAAPYFTGGTGTLYRNLRIFTMADKAECSDHLIPYVYTRSLLYFISGVLEPGPKGASVADVPVVGMQRYYMRQDIYDGADVKAVRTFMSADPKRSVWSPTADGAAGLSSRAMKHTAFDEDQATLDSLVTLIKAGY